MSKDAYQQTHSVIRQNLVRLSSIRAVALLGQVVALIYFTLLTPIGLPATAIALILAVYASVTAATWQRSRMQVPITDNEFFVHLLTDILFFSLLLYFSGGASNPFISYYLIPISIAAITLSRRYSIFIALAAMVAYSLLLKFYMPIAAIAPSHHHHVGGNNSLHILGMWANFAISTGIIIYFISRMAAALKIQQQEIALQREAQLRDEQLLAVGTLAAGTAHELGTPLNTMKLVVDEMRADGTDNPDLTLLNEQIDQCKTTLKQLLTTAEESQSSRLKAQSVHSYFAAIAERWQLMRPTLKANIRYAHCPDRAAVFDPTIAQSILNLLNNAADASIDVDVDFSWNKELATIDIRDYGSGLDPMQMDSLGEAFVTDKADGLGLGLFLSQATLTRFGGSVSLQNIAPNDAKGGTLTRILLPLKVGTE
jgi:two-component system sensor histidine kinase RegB